MKVSTAFSLPVLKTGREEGLLVSQREESQQSQGREQKDRDAKEKERRDLLYFKFQSTKTHQKTFISIRCSAERLG